jgi:DEAD/DEAH box helicase domain-containing protein
MSGEIILDIETQNTFQEIGKHDHTQLKVSLLVIYDTSSGEFSTYLESELGKLWPVLERADRLIGYNLKGFDIPVLNNYYPGDLRRIQTLDIMEEIEKKVGFRVKLDDVAQTTLGVGKSGTGLMAIEYWRKGEIEKLKAYCEQDVRVTRDLYNYGLEKKEVAFVDRLGRKISVPVDFGQFQVKQALNYTMPF